MLDHYSIVDKTNIFADMEQLVIGRELPNLKITLAGLEATNSNSNVETDIMEVDEEQDDKPNEENDGSNVKIDVKLEFMSYKGMKRYENKHGSLANELDLTSEEIQEKLEKRAKRFQIESRKKNKITQEEIEALYKSLNINTSSEKSSEKNRGIRLDAIHIRGVNDMSTDDIFSYFGEYGPSSIEWINDVSCNVVWLDESSAARALLGLSRPLILRRKRNLTEESDCKAHSQEAEDEEKFIEGGEEVVMMSEDESSDEEAMPVDNAPQQDNDISSSLTNNNGENPVTTSPTTTSTIITNNCAVSSPITTISQENPVIIQELPIAAQEDPITVLEYPISTQENLITIQEDPVIIQENSVNITSTTTSAAQEDPVTTTPPESPVTTTTTENKDTELEEKIDEELPLSVPPGYWRLGVPHPKAKVLLLRFATKDDKKIRGAEKRSVYYKKYGNPNYGGMKGLISNSRKRRFWQIQQKRELQELGIKNNENMDASLQNNIKRVETSSSESENEPDDVLKPLRRKLRMKMYADEEENKQKNKRLRLLSYRRKDGRIVTRKKLMQSVMVGTTQTEDSDGSFDDQDDVLAGHLHQSGISVWERLTHLDENSAEFEETSDLRNKLQSRGANVDEWTQRSMAPVTGDLRGKLDRIRNKQHVREHRSPLLIHVANDQSD